MVALPMLLLAGLALAGGTAPGGLQLALYPPLTDRVAGWMSDTTHHVEKADVSAPYDCWDLLGVRGFNLDVPIRTVSLEPREGALDLTVTFGEIRGEDMELYAIDSEYTDTCVEFEAWVSYVSFTDGRLDASLAVEVDRGEVRFGFVGAPSVTGDLDTDIEWFPDDIVLYFFEDEILAAVEEAIADIVPPYLDEALAETALAGAYEDFEVTVEPADAAVDRDGVHLAADVGVTWSGDDGCPQGELGDAGGANPGLALGDGDGASFAVGLTERMVGELFLSLYEDGWFCFTEANVAEFVALVQDLFDPAVGGLAATAELAEAPTVRIQPDGIRFGLDGARIVVTGEYQGRAEEVLVVEADVAGRLEVSLDRDTSAFHLSLTELALDITRFEAERLVTGDGEAHLRDFLEGWLADWVVASTRDVELYASLWHLYGLVVRVDRLDYQEGGLALYATLYDADDPEVDTEAPETAAEVWAQGRDGARVTWSGVDDREGSLAFAWQLDGGGYSAWSTEAGVDLAGLGEGSHTVEVVARDGWWNVDPTPVALTFAVDELPEAPAEPGGCGCASGGGAGYAAVGLAALVARRRRRARADHSSGLQQAR